MRALWLLPIMLLAACSSESPAPEVSGPIFIISVDTLRADHLPIYGATAVDTPHIDALAADSIVFENAYSQVPLTLPSHTSMLTGKLPAEIGVRNNLGYRFDPATPSIPTLLREKGYETGAAVSAYVLRAETGLGAAFDHYDDEMKSSGDGAVVGEIQRSGEETVTAALDWLRSRSSQQIFFFLHLFEPHAPYQPAGSFAQQYAERPYDGEIATADAAIGRFLEGLKEMGLYEDATIIFMSDHGEGLGDHGESQHGIFLYREAIHVPLLLKLPSAELAGTRVDRPVALLDVVPTLAELGAFEAPGEQLPGHSLLARDSDSSRRIYSETMYPRIHLGWSDLASLVDEAHHFIEAPRPELYDLSSDPRETRNILSEERRVYASMREELAEYERELAAPQAISPEEAAKLSALGYLGGPTGGDEGGALPDPKDRISDLEGFMKASEAVRSGSAETALSELEQIVERNPSFADAWTLLGKAYDQQGRYEDAVEAYRKTIEAAPMLAPGTALSLAEIYVKLGRFEDALEHADLARETHPASSALARARALLAMGRIGEADQALGSAMTDSATRDDARVLQAQSLTMQRRFDEALTLLQQMKGNGPVAGASFAEGDVLARLGRMDDAKRSFTEEIARFPRNREAYIRLAAIHLLSGNVSAAEDAMRRLAAANPSPSTRAMIAEAYRGLGRPDLAAKW